MARPLRIPLTDGVYHVFARGNAKQEIYLDDRDRHIFLDLVAQVLRRFAWRCLAYCLMPNHYHLVVRTSGPDLSNGMRQINGVYAQRFNYRHDRAGHVFQGRFGATLIQEGEHLLEAIRYVVLNPVRAGLAKRVDEWPWCSQSELLGQRPRKALSAPDLLSLFGSNTEESMERYLEFISTPGEDIQLESVSVFGDEDFMAKHLGECSSRQEVSGRAWSGNRPSLADLLEVEDVDGGIAEAYRVHGYAMREIASALGCHYATVSRRLRKFESRIARGAGRSSQS